MEGNFAGSESAVCRKGLYETDPVCADGNLSLFEEGVDGREGLRVSWARQVGTKAIEVSLGRCQWSGAEASVATGQEIWGDEARLKGGRSSRKRWVRVIARC